MYHPQAHYAHRWRSDDLVIADNRTLLHGREAFVHRAPRHLRRVISTPSRRCATRTCSATDQPRRPCAPRPASRQGTSMSHSVPNALMTGADYLDSLRDGRQVYLNGERVADVTRHRAFRNACRSIAGLYDGLHGEQRDVLTRVDAQGRRSHRFFTPAQNAEDLLGARGDRCWSRMTYGFMGRTRTTRRRSCPGWRPAPASTATTGRTPAPGTAPSPTAGCSSTTRSSIRRWTAARRSDEMRDVFVHVERETDQGIVVSGAKMLATGSAITNATFVAPVASAQMEAGKAEDFAVVFFARMDNPGLRLMCRPSYEEREQSLRLPAVQSFRRERQRAAVRQGADSLEDGLPRPAPRHRLLCRVGLRQPVHLPVRHPPRGEAGTDDRPAFPRRARHGTQGFRGYRRPSAS
ncbi:4-hydroxyphenylacetate 3-hydroxylase N-terminal domain-containing protein [Pseudomonas aeruginosa]|nr:4-hydroxyphenylacetate 3-hydroxylase N-terminal domain-containing protein [Pseudomonas aeruginosa]